MDNPFMDNSYEKLPFGNNGRPPDPTGDECSAFSIHLRFLGGLNDGQMAAFKRAADRWSRVIVGGLSPVFVDGEVIHGVLILAEAIDIDGVGRVLGQAGPTLLRPAAAGRGGLLPAKGKMQFDRADLASMEQDGRLEDVIAHEMGHVLGVGTIWFQKELVDDVAGANPTFRGPAAMREYATLRGYPGQSMPVPLENIGAPGTVGSHWRETIVANELMSGVIGSRNNPLSRLTVACLLDLGYTVDMSAAEPYALPSLVERAERGRYPFAIEAQAPEGIIPLIPSILPSESLL